MARKELDLTLLQQELDARRTGKRTVSTAQKQVEKQLQAMDTMLDMGDFDVVEDGADVIVIQNAVDLPSDEDIERMKHAMAERDRIEREEWYNGLSWWRKFLFKLGVVEYAGRG